MCFSFSANYRALGKYENKGILLTAVTNHGMMNLAESIAKTRAFSEDEVSFCRSYLPPHCGPFRCLSCSQALSTVDIVM